MADKELQSKSKNQVTLPTVADKKSDLAFINDQFKVGKVVNQLHDMMEEVTKGGYDAKNVNAACNCIGQLNQIINTTINAARFLRD